MKINKLRKITSDKYEITFDNNVVVTTYDSVIIENNLLYKIEVDSELYNKISKETSYYDIYSKVLKFISRKIRSEKEVREHLKKFNLEEKEELKIIKELKNKNFINDINFTKAFISDKFYLSNDGPVKIKSELLEHNISDALIENEISKIEIASIIDKLKKIINKKINLNHKYSNTIMKQKLMYELSNLGYEREMINNLVDNYKVNNTNIISKEYLKIYNKLSKKYQGNELNYKIKEKLYQKGFDFDSINEVMKKDCY